MATLALPRGAAIRPRTGAPGALGHPLASGLVAAFLFNEGPGCVDLVTRNVRLAPASGTSFGELGLHALAADHGAEVNTPTALQLALPLTIAAYFTPRGAPDGNSLIFGVLHNNSDTSPWHSYSIAYDGSGNVTFRGNSAGSFTDLSTGVSGSSLAHSPTVAVATVTSSAREVWLNGVSKTSSTGVSNPTYGSPPLLAGGDYTGVSRNSNIVLHAGYIWNRALTDSEIVELAVQPYAFVYTPSPHRRDLEATAGGGGGGTPRFFAVF